MTTYRFEINADNSLHVAACPEKDVPEKVWNDLVSSIVLNRALGTTGARTEATVDGVTWFAEASRYRVGDRTAMYSVLITNDPDDPAARQHAIDADHAAIVDEHRTTLVDAIDNLRAEARYARRAVAALSSNHVYDVEVADGPRETLLAALDQIDVAVAALAGLAPKPGA